MKSNMIVRVISQGNDGDLLCESDLGVIKVDPFVGCAIDTDDIITTGLSMLGKQYNMAEFWESARTPGCYLCHHFSEIPEGPKQ